MSAAEDTKESYEKAEGLLQEVEQSVQTNYSIICAVVSVARMVMIAIEILIYLARRLDRIEKYASEAATRR